MGQCILRDFGIEFEKLKGKKRELLEAYLKERLSPYKFPINSRASSLGEGIKSRNESREENKILALEENLDDEKMWEKTNEHQKLRMKSASKKQKELYKEDDLIENQFNKKIEQRSLLQQEEENPDTLEQKKERFDSLSDSFEVKENPQNKEQEIEFRPKTKTAFFGSNNQNTKSNKENDNLNEHVVVLKSSDGFKRKNIQLNMSRISDKSQIISSKPHSNEVSREDTPRQTGTIFDKMNQNLKKSLTKRRSVKDTNSPLSSNSKNNTSQRSNNLLDSLHEDQNAKPTITWTEKKTVASGTIKEYQKGFPNVVFQVLEKETETPSRHHHTEVEYASIFNDDDYNSDNSDLNKDYVNLKFPEMAKHLKK